VSLIKAVSDTVAVPVIASGGMGNPEDLLAVVNQGNADAVAMADILHYKRADISDIRAVAKNAGLGVRHYECT
jgi:cyclase